MEKDTKTIKVSKQLHKDLKQEALNKDYLLQELVEKILRDYLDEKRY